MRRGAIHIAIAALLVAPFFARAGGTVRAARNDLPPVILWAWERAEDLGFLDPRAAGVAFLAETITMRPSGSIVRPRLQPLRVRPGTALVAVVRIEATTASLGGSDERQGLARGIAELQSFPGVRAIQIDFDARRSERAFYRALLEDVRQRLSPATGLSITALASWCLGDRWLDELRPGTIDEAVPMLFRMGPDESAVAAWLESGRRFSVSACRKSLGVSTDEPLSRTILADAGLRRRVYVFNPRPWSSEVVKEVLDPRRR